MLISNSCSNTTHNDNKSKTHEIYFNYLNDDIDNVIYVVNDGDKVLKPSFKTYKDYIDVEWHLSSELNNLYDFNNVVNKSFTLYAKWIPKKEEIKEEPVISSYEVSYTIISDSLTNTIDPYENVDIDEFYKNYTISNSYIDSYYRSKHKLLSGEYIVEDGSLPSKENNLIDEETGLYYKNSKVRYEVNDNNELLSFTINTLDGNDYKIYKGGIYVSLNDVAAYLFAFNELPINYLAGTSKKDKTKVVEEYGEFGRLNFKNYSGPSEYKYQYEPYLCGQEDDTIFYKEIDYGANSGEHEYFSYGKTTSRQIFRFLLGNSLDSSYTKPTSINERYVYYTYNHYNDFSEYLNYYNGFGKVFGNETAGNAYNQYNSSNPPTKYEKTIFKNF